MMVPTRLSLLAVRTTVWRFSRIVRCCRRRRGWALDGDVGGVKPGDHCAAAGAEGDTRLGIEVRSRCRPH